MDMAMGNKLLDFDDWSAQPDPWNGGPSWKLISGIVLFFGGLFSWLLTR